MSNFLSIGRTLYPVNTLGPGNRYVIWVQGCPFSCKGCCSPDYIPFNMSRKILVDDLVNDIVSQDDIEGVTLSGGEPFAQPGALSLLIKKVKAQRPDLNFISFTGYSFEALTSKPQKELLNSLDLVITELFVEELNSEYGLRGSDNQQFIFLTDRLEPFREGIINGKKITETFILNEQVVQVGVMSESEKYYHQSLLEIFRKL
jgi:anaerobic ribonucleoside-triphosphate reductase activating protein